MNPIREAASQKLSRGGWGVIIEGKSMTGEMLFSSLPPSNYLVSVSDPEGFITLEAIFAVT